MRRTTWIVGGGSGAVLVMALLAAACAANGASVDGTSSDTDAGGADSTTGADARAIDSGSHFNSDSASGYNDSAASGDDGGVIPDDSGNGGADCGKIAALHPSDGGGGVYCPFTDIGTDGGSRYCPSNQECCAPKFPLDTAAQTCLPLSQTCSFAVDGGLQIQCEEDTDCTGGKLCCVAVSALNQDPGCTNYWGSWVKGSTCKTSCQAGDFHSCQAQSQCTSGTCTPFRAVGRDWGACR